MADMVGYATIGALFLCSLAMVVVIVVFAVCGWMAMKDWRDR